MKTSLMHRLVRGAGSVSAALALTVSAATAQTELQVYTAVEADELKMFKQAFEKDHPDITIEWVRDSTGIITAKLLAEKQNPKADVVWGVAASSLVLLSNEDYFQSYEPPGREKLKDKMIDTTEPVTWTGQRAWIASVCVNTIEAENEGLPIPQTWEDLTKPVYQGKVVMPNPASSGTGFLDVSSWIQMWGEDKAWSFMDDLHENVAWYTHSGSKPCRQAAAGEVPVGVSFAFRGAQLVERGAPIEVVIPNEGVGWDVESFAIVDGTDHLEAAKVFADWSVTREANELYNEAFAVIAMPGIAESVPHYPAEAEERMIDNDFEWAADNRERILEEWQSRYGSKSEPES